MSQARGRGDSIISVANRHRRLQNAAGGLDAVAHADTICDGARTDDSDPAFRTELVLGREFDAAPPTVLDAVADHDFGIARVNPQGDQLVVVCRR